MLGTRNCPFASWAKPAIQLILKSGFCPWAGLETQLGDFVGQRQEVTPPLSVRRGGGRRLSPQQVANLLGEKVGDTLLVHRASPLSWCCRRPIARHKTTLTVFSFNAMICPISRLLNWPANLSVMTS